MQLLDFVVIDVALAEYQNSSSGKGKLISEVKQAIRISECTTPAFHALHLLSVGDKKDTVPSGSRIDRDA